MKRWWKKPKLTKGEALKATDLFQRRIKWINDNQEARMMVMERNRSGHEQIRKNGKIMPSVTRVSFKNVTGQEIELIESFWHFMEVEAPFVGPYGVTMNRKCHFHQKTFLFANFADALALKFRYGNHIEIKPPKR